MKQIVLLVLCVYIASFSGCSTSGKNNKQNSKGAMVTSAPFSIEQSMHQELEEKRTVLASLVVDYNGTDEQRIAYKQQQARLIDIPLPLQIIPDYRYSLAQEQDCSLYAFISDMSHEQLLEFYRVEMEREGWKVVTSCADIESVMVCSKPTRMSVVTIRTQKKSANKKNSDLCSHVLIRSMQLDDYYK